MKAIFSDFFRISTRAANEFQYWLINTFNVRMNQYDESIMTHRYIILCRFLGDCLEPPKYANDGKLEELIIEKFSDYADALSKYKDVDPLAELTNLPWKQRNIMNDKMFIRKTLPGISDALKPLTNFLLPSLYDALIPFKHRNAVYDALPSPESHIKVTPEEEQFWLDAVQWSWDIDNGKIKIPF